jgi:hypothetical protein
VSKTICHSLIAGLVITVATARGGDSPAKFLGANSCASSGCHGGGGAKQNQFLTWSLKDFHSQRPPATLTTARSKQISDALEIKDSTADARCTSCHAPLHEVPENLRGENFKVSEGVSCESCHGPAEKWLRPHTRTDYTRADRTATGMRDLQNLYVHANTCVACHQNVDAKILKAGHPELIFELDGQSVAEPNHWSAEKNGNGAQAWLVGQAVALRELSWQLAQEKSPTENQINRWEGLAWLLQVATTNGIMKTPLFVEADDPIKQSVIFQSGSDEIARAATSVNWTDEMTRNYLFVLAGSNDSFRAASLSQAVRARMAERLVLALDRLVTALPELKNNEPVQSALNQLFKLAQSIPDFDPKQFSAALEKFSARLNK